MTFDLKGAVDKMVAAESITPMTGNCILRDAIGFERHYTYNEERFRRQPTELVFYFKIEPRPQLTFDPSVYSYRVDMHESQAINRKTFPEEEKLTRGRIFRYRGMHPQLNKPLYVEYPE